MSDHLLPQHQCSQMKRLLNDHSYDLKRQYERLQAQLCRMHCENAAVRQICRQLVAEGIVDKPEVKKFIECTEDNDFEHLVWIFVSREPEDIKRFLGVLKNITGYPVLSRKFSNKIDEFMPENSINLDTRILIDREEPTGKTHTENSLPAEVLGGPNDDENETQQYHITGIHKEKQEINENELHTNTTQVVPSQGLEIPNADDRNQENIWFLAGYTLPNIEVKNKPGFLKTKNGRRVIGIMVVGVLVGIVLIGFLLFADLTKQTAQNTADLPTTSTLEPHPDLISDEVYETRSNVSEYSYRFLR